MTHKPRSVRSLPGLAGLVRALVLALSVLVGLGSLTDAPLRTFVFEAPTEALPPGTARPAALGITVIDGTGKVVAAAHVAVFTFEGGVAHRSADLRTDARGHGAVNVSEGDTWITAEQDPSAARDARGESGWARASTHLVLTPGAREVSLTLCAERSVDVDVVDENGRAVAGAELEATGADPLPVGARTDAQGFAHVARLAGERFVVLARASGYEETTNRSIRAGEHVRLTLRKLGALVVVVLEPTGAPAETAHVRIAGSSLWPPRVTDVGKDGARVSSLPAGSYALEAWNDASASGVELGVVLGQGEEKKVVLHLTAGSFVDVRVTDGAADDALPVAGARVSVVESGLSPFPREAVSDARGRVHVGPFARGDFRVSAEAEGFVPASAVRAANETGETRLSLLSGGELRGRVVDTRGVAIAGATLEVVGTDVTGSPIDEDPQRDRFRRSAFDATLAGPVPLVAAGELGVMPGPVPPIPHALAAGASVFAPAPTSSSVPAGSAGAGLPSSFSPTSPAREPREPWVSRGDGTFRLAPIPQGRVRILARHPQYVEGMSEIVLFDPAGRSGSFGGPDPGEITLVLSSGGALEGRVVDDSSRPVGGARVTLAATVGAFEQTTRTASDGTFAFASVPSSATLFVSRDPLSQSADVRLPVDVPERGRRDLLVTLPEARPPLHVRVTDDRGFPLAMVQLNADSLDAASPLRTTAFSDSRGEAVLLGARGVPLKIEARAPAHATVRLEADGQNDLTVVMPPGLTAAGEVRGLHHGEPVAGAEILLYADDGPHRARSDAQGAYQLADLPSGNARLEARAPGYAPASRTLILATVLPRLELDDEAVVTGEIVDDRGRSIAGARVSRGHVPVYLAAAGAPGPSSGVVVSDARGRFRLGQLPDGDSVLEAYAADVGRGHAEVHLFAGTTAADVRITLSRERGAPGDEAARGESAGGVAITLGERTVEREVVLVAVAEGSQAERAGLLPGDVLVSVDGHEVGTLEEARARLTGPLADDVLVEVRRTSEGAVSARVLRYRVARESVRR